MLLSCQKRQEGREKRTPVRRDLKTGPEYEGRRASILSFPIR